MNTCKYKIGDIVCIKSMSDIGKIIDSKGCVDGLPFRVAMNAHCSARMTIDQLDDIHGYYRMTEDPWHLYNDEMIERKVASIDMDIDSNTEDTYAETDLGEVSDGYHTFNELYEYRLLYNAGMFNELAKSGLYDVHKSKLHSDGNLPFDDPNWFIVMAELPTGQISNHYEMKDWNLFNIPEKEKANVWDGHSPKDVAERLRKYLSGQRAAKITEEQYLEWMDEFFCSNGAKEYASWKKYLKKAAAKNNLSSIWESMLHGRLGMMVRNYMREHHPEIDDDMQSYAAFEDYSWKLIQKLVKTW